jgi:uncharacterized protein (DUF924 family)
MLCEPQPVPAIRSCDYSTMTDGQIQHILEFWFSGSELDSPRVDSRMDRWFGDDDGDLSRQITENFEELVLRASTGEIDHWTETAEGRLALIILLDQFRRHIYRGTAEAFLHDDRALKISVEGTIAGDHKKLSSIQRMFYFMPLQHSESLKIQEKSVSIFIALADSVSETLRETFLTAAHFAELRRDIVAEFGRFPHRNPILGREDTAAEQTYLAGHQTIR